MPAPEDIVDCLLAATIRQSPAQRETAKAVQKNRAKGRSYRRHGHQSESLIAYEFVRRC